MTKKILIDAAFPEETRVAVVDDDRLDNLDREMSSIKQLKGNIYLAKIIRIEPSLQSAFVNYGGDRHGFLPFADIHPDYYNVPEDKKTDLGYIKHFSTDKVSVPQETTETGISPEDNEITTATAEDFEVEDLVELDENNEPLDYESLELPDETDSYDAEEEEVELYNSYRQYKIEDVLKEGQYLLVQVLKEERGLKGVALTTYISIAGKYCVLMANVENKGGVSKKINNLRDRKILRNILNTLNPNNDKSVIIRTAGVGKKPEEIARDYTYLMRLWDAIRQTALESKAPSFIHSEDDIIKRTVRDIYNETVDEVLVEGEEAYKSIKNMTKLIAPEQKTSIKQYTDKTPLFYKYDIEEQVGDLYLNKVLLPSGGSIVIDQTEALVTIDVNSGKATKDKTVEEMAVNTNLEAAREIARQLRLRDIGGLIVIDFIDMYDSKNKRNVERTLRDACETDKARIQIDRLTMFGLLEMSRQRINASFRERVSEKCPCCEGRGMVRSKYIVANNIFRNIKYVTREKHTHIVNVISSQEIVSYILNYKREQITELEKNYNLHIFFKSDANMANNEYEIIRRDELTAEEKFDISPEQRRGKVNELFDDEFLYNSVNAEVDLFNFKEDCYFPRGDKGGRSQNSRQNNRSLGRGRNKEKRQNNRKPAKTGGIFGKLKNIFGGK